MAQPVLYLDYNKTSKDLTDAGLDESKVFYLPKKSQDRRAYLNFFWTWQTSISYYDRILNVRPCRFYFIKDGEFDAEGGRINDCFFVGISSGTVDKLKVFFMDGASSIFEKLPDKSFSSLNRKSWDSFQSLMRDASLRFIFDHEFAHVIQEANGEQDWKIKEFNNFSYQKKEYSEEGHIKEYDADIRGAWGVASAILSYWESVDGPLKTKEYLRTLVITGLASIICLFSLLPSPRFYVEEYDHPHPAIRARYVMFYLHGFFLTNNEYTTMSREEIFGDAWTIANLFLHRKPGMWITSLKKVFMDNKDAVDSYVSTLEQRSANYPFLVKHNDQAWNLPDINHMGIVEIDMPGYAMSISEFEKGDLSWE